MGKRRMAVVYLRVLSLYSMAKKSKNKSTNPESEGLQSDPVEKIKVKQLLKDERTHKIAGSICILFAILFLYRIHFLPVYLG